MKVQFWQLKINFQLVKMKHIKREIVNAKCMYLQEDFLKENILIQIRMVLDRRNLKNNMENGDFTFSS